MRSVEDRVKLVMPVLPEAQFCPECGAKVLYGQTCIDYFHACMEKEFTDAEYGAVHHLTVPTYMLQHPSQLSRQGWLEMRKILVEFVIEGKSIPEMRLQVRTSADSSKRVFSFRKGEPIVFSNVVWSRTIADICLDEAMTYCADITALAQSVVTDTEATAYLEP